MNIAGLPNAAIPVGMSQLGQTVGLQVMRLAQDEFTQQGQDVVSLMENSVRPYLGGSLDIRA